MSNIFKTAVGFIVLFISLVILVFSYYIFQLSPISSDSQMVQIEIPKGSSGTAVANILKENGLIRGVNVFKIYLKTHGVENISYGIYELNKAMGVKKIIDIISNGKTFNDDIKILFKEGLNMRGIAQTIATNTLNAEEDVFALLDDTEYIDGLINEYWFLEEVIKDKGIYYPLEGYLAPNTYQFTDENVSVDKIFRRMLDQTDRILTPYKNIIKDYTIHEYLTFASIVQSEGINNQDMSNIAGVFYKRLNEKWSLGSCVTACYAMKLDLCTSSKVDTKIDSPYNTYLSKMIGRLPIGPVSNPGVEAIKAAINPASNDYYYFLSDKNKKTYFSRTNAEHINKKAELKAAGLWLD